jgi:hypothetical protein
MECRWQIKGASMYVRYVALETILHPMTRERIVTKGVIYDQRQIGLIALRTGMDNLQVQMFVGHHREDTVRKACDFVNGQIGDSYERAE